MRRLGGATFHRAESCEGWGRGFESLRLLQFFNVLSDRAFVAESDPRLIGTIYQGGKRDRTRSGFMLGKAFHTPRVHAMVAGLLDRMASGELAAVIDRRFSLSDGAAAHTYAESRGRVGRITLVP